MKLVYRYLGARLIYGYALISAVFFALFGLFEFRQRAEEIGVAQFSVTDALWVTLMAMPACVIDLSPFIALLGVIYGLSLMVRDNELIALRSAGMTPLHLVMVCALTSTGFMLLTTIAEFGARPLAQQAELTFMQQTSNDGSMIAKSGIWTELENGYQHVEILSDSGAPEGIYWYEFHSDGRLAFMRHATDATIGDDGVWQLRDVTEKRLFDANDDGGTQIASAKHDNLSWTPETLYRTSIYQMPLQTLTLQELYARIAQLHTMGKSAGLFAMEFWQRCLLPISAIAFSLFAAPIVLGVGPRASMGGIVTLSVGAAFVLYLVQQLLADALHLIFDRGLLASGIPLLLVLLPALWLIYRVQRKSA